MRCGRAISRSTPTCRRNEQSNLAHSGCSSCIKAFSETDFTEDLKKFDVPTLVIHGDDDQIVPIGAGGQASATIVKNATLKVYPKAPHGSGGHAQGAAQYGPARLPDNLGRVRAGHAMEIQAWCISA
jgi:pimeloyl-ACP methyl ester carboxylesterase